MNERCQSVVGLMMPGEERERAKQISRAHNDHASVHAVQSTRITQPTKPVAIIATISN